jgi:hypothetical protein
VAAFSRLGAKKAHACALLHSGYATDTYRNPTENLKSGQEKFSLTSFDIADIRSSQIA